MRRGRAQIDITSPGTVIDPLWFGHNLEHTRRVMWGGLAAELLKGRKFTGTRSPGGVAEPWHPVGPPSTLFLVERELQRPHGAWGDEGGAYVTRYDFDPRRRDGGVQRQAVVACEDAVCGIAQNGLFLEGGHEYEGYVALSADRPLEATVSVSGRDGAGPYYAQPVSVGPDGWTEHEFGFRAPTDDGNADFRVTFGGPGALYAGCASLRPAGHFLGMRRDVVELLKEIGVPVLRWPGGNFAGCYRWRDGLLPPHRRAPLPGGGILPYTSGYDDHEVGTDEFVALCREVGAEPWITINMGIEGPRDAAAWVEYCNGSAHTRWGAVRAERGFSQPHGVTYWSLGNEMGYGHMRGPNEPAAYGRMARQCAEAMRAVDDSIVLVASGKWEEDEWYSDVLATTGDCFEHVSFHEYAPLVRDYVGAAGREELLRLVRHPRSTFDVMRDMRARLDADAPDGKAIGISFDEWNLWHTWFRRPGVAEALFTAAMLNMFCRRAAGLAMTMGAYFEPVNEGAILVERDGARLTPAGQVFALFRAHWGSRTVPVDMRPRGNLDVAASLDEAGRLTLTVINPEPESSTAFEAQVRGAAELVDGSARALVGDSHLPGSEFASLRTEVRLSGSTLACEAPPLSVMLLQAACVPD